MSEGLVPAAAFSSTLVLVGLFLSVDVCSASTGGTLPTGSHGVRIYRQLLRVDLGEKLFGALVGHVFLLTVFIQTKKEALKILLGGWLLPLGVPED